MAGKGSAPRPLSVSDEEFGKRFDAIDWSEYRTDLVDYADEVKRRLDAGEDWRAVDRPKRPDGSS